jgi:hypothetical protein
MRSYPDFCTAHKSTFFAYMNFLVPVSFNFSDASENRVNTHSYENGRMMHGISYTIIRLQRGLYLTTVIIMPSVQVVIEDVVDLLKH